LLVGKFRIFTLVMVYPKRTAVMLALTISSVSFAVETDTATIMVIASGETHGMLYPCDCPGDPGGGLAERASVIKKASGADADALLFIDAGGFAGGGMYDENTGGRAADSERTAMTVRAMGVMHYDAVAVGDDDLQYGAAWLAKTADAAGVPLVSANCSLSDAKSFVPAYRVVVKSGVRFAVTALTSPERLFPTDDSCRVLPPVASLRKIWKEMAASADFRVIISHLGEEMSSALADSFPECDIIVNGHRKTSQYPLIKHGKTAIMQFGYGGKKLSYAVLSCFKKSRDLTVEKNGWLGVGKSDGADSSVAKVLAAKGEAERRAVYDLYLMSQCSYGCAALSEFTDFARKFPDVEWDVWFIGSVVSGPGDSLSSPHGTEELYDEMRWLAVKALYPGRWLSFLEKRAIRGATTESVVSSMGLDSAAIGAWVRASGRQAIAGHYRRAMRLAITASPTLVVNNAAFDRPVESRRLAKMQCMRSMFLREGTKKYGICDSLPACFDDDECRSKGMIGRCLPVGKCAFTPDAKFPFVALVADSTVQHPEQAVIATTAELFPNADITTVTAGSAKGRTMVKTHRPAALPFYLFGDGIVRAHHYPRVESGLTRAAGGFTFKDGVTPKNYFPQRPRIAGAASLFIDPLFPGAVKALSTLFTDTLLAKRVRIVPVFYADPRDKAAVIDEKVRREEALRWLVLDSLHHGAFPQYLAHFIKDPGSSYWFINLSASGIAQDIFIKEIQAGASRLDDHWRLLNAVCINSPITLLLENRQTVVLRSESELAEMVERCNLTVGK
jgi:hypothetical protein